MKFEIVEGGNAVLLVLREEERTLLGNIANAADVSGSSAAEKRLFHPPTEHAGSKEERECASFWRQYVLPDLKTQFTEAIETLEDDLSKAELVTAKKGKEKTYRTRIPLDHVEQWYSALNQARLALHEKHDLPESDDLEGALKLLKSNLWQTYMQSRFYAELQCWFLELVMT